MDTLHENQGDFYIPTTLLLRCHLKKDTIYIYIYIYVYIYVCIHIHIIYIYIHISRNQENNVHSYLSCYYNNGFTATDVIRTHDMWLHNASSLSNA